MKKRHDQNRPGCWITTSFGERKWKTFPTYQELKKHIKELVLENSSEDNEITVFRSRRGEWGEWFEKWCLRNGKPHKFKEGWM